MEASASSTMLDNADKALKSMLNKFGSKLSLEDITSAFCKARGDTNLAGELLCGTRSSSSDTAHVSNGSVKSTTSSKLPGDNHFAKSIYANGNGDCRALRLKNNPVSMGTFSSALGKNNVWRARTNVTPNGRKPLEVEVSKFSGSVNSSGEPLKGRDTDGSLNKGTEKSMLDTFSSKCSLEDIASGFCKATGNTNLAGELLCGTSSSSSDTAHASNKTSSELSGDNHFGKSFYANGNGDCKALRLKRNPVSMGTVSSALGKNYVWRARTNVTPNGAKPLEVEASKFSGSVDSSGEPLTGRDTDASLNKEIEKCMLDTLGSKFSLENIDYTFSKARGDTNLAGELLCGTSTSSSDTAHVTNGSVKSKASSKLSGDNHFSKSLYVNGNGDWKALRLKRSPVSMSTVSNALGKNYVWRARTNVTLNEAKQLEVEASKFSGSVDSLGEPLTERDTDTNSNKEIENFLFEMLGQGFQLERSAISEVLDQCGYDMKKSMETLLALAAVTLDKRNNFHGGSNLKSNSETLSSQNQVPKQKFDESQSRTNGSCEQQKEVSTALFHVPERPDLVVSPSGLQSVTRARAYQTVVTEPDLKHIDEDRRIKATSSHIVNKKDEAEEGSYEFLRKAVKEYRTAMNEYYKAAAEAFASGDRARAGILLEKGQFFCNKAREADDESAQKIFETSSEDGEINDEMCLDLQHHDAKEAVRLIKCHLRLLCGIPSIMNLKIILGTGEKDVEKRKQLVKKLLEKEAIRWIEDKNLGTMLIHLDEINPKRLSFAQKHFDVPP